MINASVSYQIWLKLPKEIRDKLVVMFHIPRSGSTVVDYGAAGTVVVSDGFKPEDIESITLEKMQTVMDTDSTDFYGLFEEIILNIDALMQPKVASDHNGNEELTPAQDIVKTPFCPTCTSKGVRHLKTCPKIAKHDGQKTTQE